MRARPWGLAALVCAVVAIAPACTSTVGPDKPEAVIINRFGPVGHSMTAFGGYADVQQFAIHDPTTMANVWEQIYQNFSPKPAVPVVDFTRDMVVVVAMGKRPTGGYEILLDSAARDSHGLTVYYHSVGPDRSADVAHVITQPVDAGVVSRGSGVIDFQDLGP